MCELLYAKHLAGTVVQVVVELVRLTAGVALTLSFALVRRSASSVREVHKSTRGVVKTGGAARAET